jgi:DNA polymerase-3 subunit gamma/tau
VALARGGSGTVDVIEIDAASHGGVDDARDLRERASYGPAQSRYKIYIIDEAHMVTPQGFNALLKIVEEPPEHVKFVFATTEPEKVIGTIRSPHAPLPVPARAAGPPADYMEQLCVREGVAVAPGVLSFVVRAGGGSVRDSLSVLDQLMAGSGDAGLTYESAAALLGFTDAELLDATIDALAAGDAAGSSAIDRVVETGLDPRRFVEDLLERLRDLIVVAATQRGGGGSAAARPAGPAGADAGAGGGLRIGGAVPGGRCRQCRAHRDDRHDGAAVAARAHRCPRAASRRRRGGGVCRPPRPARASP